jgi:pimeloyl-ACP methyl ester carboxylesterase
MVSADDLEVMREGCGPPVLFIHGSVVGAASTWRHQLALGCSWSLAMPNRPGFGTSRPLARGDFEAEAPLFAALLGDGAHLVGHSYGAVIALYAAALRPGAVRSLTVSEPGCMRVAAGDPVVDVQIANGELLYERADELAPLDFLRAFRGGVRPPWEADPPLEALGGSFPTMVISGGHSAVFEAVCDAVAGRLSAERAVLSGRRHTIPAVGEPYNQLLHSFLRSAEEKMYPKAARHNRR